MRSLSAPSDEIDRGDRNMRSVDTSLVQPERQSYRPIRDDPKYDEIKNIIDKFSPEQMERLKRYIQRWSRKSSRTSQPRT